MSEQIPHKRRSKDDMDMKIYLTLCFRKLKILKIDFNTHLLELLKFKTQYQILRCEAM